MNGYLQGSHTVMSESSSEPRIIRYKISQKMAHPLGFELLKRIFGDWPVVKAYRDDR
jgi:hypothetical protein